jgi:hypothetical protein
MIIQLIFKVLEEQTLFFLLFECGLRGIQLHGHIEFHENPLILSTIIMPVSEPEDMQS